MILQRPDRLHAKRLLYASRSKTFIDADILTTREEHGPPAITTKITISPTPFQVDERLVSSASEWREGARRIHATQSTLPYSRRTRNRTAREKEPPQWAKSTAREHQISFQSRVQHAQRTKKEYTSEYTPVRGFWKATGARAKSTHIASGN